MKRALSEPRFYGRRRGHRLGTRQRERLERVLDRFGIPADGRALDLSHLFPDGRDVWLEIGFGSGEHLAAQAAANPRVGLIGCEPYINGVASLARLIEERNLTNVQIFAEDARLLLPRIAAAALARVFLLFPDPWPKKRHHRRRFIQPASLDQLARILRDGAAFRFATDHAGYCRWTLHEVRAHGAFVWTARGPADWRQRPADWPPTRYEEKARILGKEPIFLRFARRARDTAEGT